MATEMKCHRKIKKNKISKREHQKLQQVKHSAISKLNNPRSKNYIYWLNFCGPSILWLKIRYSFFEFRA